MSRDDSDRNFGIVTRFHYQLHPVPPLLAGPLLYRIQDAAQALREFGQLAGQLADRIAANAALVTAPPVPLIPAGLHGQPMLALTLAWIGPAGEGLRQLAPLRGIARPTADLVGELPYTALQSMFDAATPAGLHGYVRSEWG